MKRDPTPPTRFTTTDGPGRYLADIVISLEKSNNYAMDRCQSY